MLRVTSNETPRVRTLHLEGRLEGPWATLLETCWRKTVSGNGGHKAFRVDMSGVSWVSSSG
jgi:hypothetical protein